MITKETLSIYMSLIRSGIELESSQIEEIENLIDQNEKLTQQLTDAIDSIKEVVYIEGDEIYNCYQEGTSLREFIAESTVKLIRGEQNK